MSISAISATSSSYPGTIQNSFKQRDDDLTALKTALQSGDLSSAQSAFATFKQDLQGAKQSATSNSQPAQDFQSLESALSSGDIASAQKAFAAFQTDVQTAHKAHHHHHKTAPVDATQTPDASNSASVGGVLGTILNQQA